MAAAGQRPTGAATTNATTPAGKVLPLVAGLAAVEEAEVGMDTELRRRDERCDPDCEHQDRKQIEIPFHASRLSFVLR
jgi:hypothetical protein